MRDNITEEYWSKFADTYDQKMEYVVGKKLLDEIIQELNRLPDLGEFVKVVGNTTKALYIIGQKHERA